MSNVIVILNDVPAWLCTNTFKDISEIYKDLSKSRFCGAVASTLCLASLSKILIKFIPSQEVTGDLTT